LSKKLIYRGIQTKKRLKALWIERIIGFERNQPKAGGFFIGFHSSLVKSISKTTKNGHEYLKKSLMFPQSFLRIGLVKIVLV